jgi:hypothetical protein
MESDLGHQTRSVAAYNQGGDDAEKSGAGGGTDSDSLNRTQGR